MRRAPAPAKLNLALVVGPRGDDGKHEVTTIYQRLDLADRIAIEDGVFEVRGFGDDTIVRRALESLARAAGIEPRWRATITKKIPVAAGLGGGSSDAATALRLAAETLDEPPELEPLARALGADVPFFLRPGPQLGEGDGGELTALDLPQDYWVVLALPPGARKESTASVYEAFNGADGYEERRDHLLETLAQVHRPRDLADLPPNDLASSPLAAELLRLGAFRADVSGAGPIVYGLFPRRSSAEAARKALPAQTWLTIPAWYG